MLAMLDSLTGCRWMAEKSFSTRITNGLRCPSHRFHNFRGRVHYHCNYDWIVSWLFSPQPSVHKDGACFYSLLDHNRSDEFLEAIQRCPSVRRSCAKCHKS